MSVIEPPLELAWYVPLPERARAVGLLTRIPALVERSEPLFETDSVFKVRFPVALTVVALEVRLIDPEEPVALSVRSPVALCDPVTEIAPFVAVMFVPPVPAEKVPVPVSEKPLLPVKLTEPAVAVIDPLF